ncbi:MAG: type II secretion system protein [Patescibacteria group bacterium]
MKHSTQKGFTLIELLVVIAIIGLLSSVVLASLNSARKKGQDASIKEQLVNFRSQAAIFSSNYPSYDYINGAQNGLGAGSRLKLIAPNPPRMYPGSLLTLNNFCGDPSMYKFLEKAQSISGTDLICSVGVNGASYAVFTSLPSDPQKIFCLDSRGYAGVMDVPQSSETHFLGNDGSGPVVASCLP